MIAGQPSADAASRARNALFLSLWTAGAVFVLSSGAVAARMASFDGSPLTQVDARQDPRTLFPESGAVERDVLDVRPPVIEQISLASVWPMTDAFDQPPVAEPQSADSQTDLQPNDYAADMSYQTDLSDTGLNDTGLNTGMGDMTAETGMAQPVPGVIECSDTCVDAHAVVAQTVETSMADTTTLPEVTPRNAAASETVILDDLLPKH